MPMSGEPANTPNFTVCVNICPTAAAPCGFCSEAATVCSQARAAVATCSLGRAPAIDCAGAPEACLAGRTYLSHTAHCATACAALSALRRCAASPAAAPCDFRRRLKLVRLPALRHGDALRLGLEEDARAASRQLRRQSPLFACLKFKAPNKVWPAGDTAAQSEEAGF